MDSIQPMYIVCTRLHRRKTPVLLAQEATPFRLMNKYVHTYICTHEEEQPLNIAAGNQISNTVSLASLAIVPSAPPLSDTSSAQHRVESRILERLDPEIVEEDLGHANEFFKKLSE